MPNDHVPTQPKESNNIFAHFTRKYALSKTLRFELKPVGKTRDWMNKNLEYDEKLQTFLKDQYIEDAYQILKPVFDRIHEEFITKSLEIPEAKGIDFTKYFDLYKKQKSELDKDERKKLDKPIEDEEKRLRKEFEELYNVAGEEFKTGAGKDNKGKDILKESGYKVLTEAGILTFLKKKLNDNPTCFDDLKLPEVKILVKNNKTNNEKIEKALEKINKFFTYFGGFNQNRENYYSTEEKATAVASRVVDENLPKFIDNALDYEKHKDEYNKVFIELKKTGKDLKLKNPKWDGKDKDSEFIQAHDIKNDEASFAINNFVHCLAQSEIDAYNTKVANVNYLVNLYFQQTGIKLPKFKVLYKQIGCGEKKEFLKIINNNEELKDVLTKVKILGEKYFNDGKDKDTIKTFIEYLSNLDNFENVYWSDKAINTISGKYFGNWSDLKEKLLKKKIFNKDKNTGEAKVPQAVNLKDLFTVLDDSNQEWFQEVEEEIVSAGDREEKAVIIGWKAGLLFRKIFKENNEEKQNIIKNAQTPHDALLKMIFEDINVLAKNFLDGADEILKIKEQDYQKDENKEKIKEWLDHALFINQILKYWKVKARYSVDSNFTDILDKVKVSEVAEDYDVIRNYLTQKPQSKLGKLKLNFENSSLGSGWDLNKEKDNSCVILKDKEGKKYLAIMKYEDTSIFEQDIANPLYASDNSGWMKMNYKLLPGPNKMLPKVLFSEKWLKNNSTPEKIKEIYKKETFKKGDDFNKNDLHDLIDFYKEQLKKYPSENESWDKLFDFNFSKTKNYESIDQFYTEVEKQGYKLEFVPINKTKIDGLVENGRIYFFEITSKDSDYYYDKDTNERKMKREKKEKKDLQTIYWNEVFANFENKPKLNGGAEIFYRPELPNDQKEGLKTKDKDGREIYKNFRYTKERFVFHCPITLNACLKDGKINDLVNKNFIGNKNQLFLGIDRGEKHLAYYSLVNTKGEILEQGSFNVINGQNYWEKLDKKQGDRDKARKNWTTIGNIKDLKDGYISQVVRRIVDLAIYNKGDREKGFRETPAFIVLEDLNIGFKRGRQKIEKQVYQKLELALAKKLNFLVDKRAKEGEIGSTENALQLTPRVSNFGDIKGKQFGIMLYTNPSFTSTTDPITGWRKSISIKRGGGDYIKDQIIGNAKKKIKAAFDDFGFDGKDYYFKYTDANTDNKWTLFSGHNGKELDRFKDKFSEKEGKKHWNPEKIEIVINLEKIFEGFDKSQSFKEQIVSGKEINKIDKDRTAWESLRFIIDIIQQIRNTGIEKQDEDFILSPVRDEKTGEYFDSRKIKESGKMPQNGDANGAYNIARKGILMFEKITEKPEKPDLFIKNEEWDAWVQKNKKI